MKSRGFTLIELLIVVAIIAILAAIALPNFLEAQTRAKYSRVKSDIRACGIAIMAYTVDQNKHPIPWMNSRTYTNSWGGSFSDYLKCPHWYDFNQYHGGMGHMITTPIAYITSIPTDPFSIQFQKRLPISNGEFGFYYAGMRPPNTDGALLGPFDGWPRAIRCNWWLYSTGSYPLGFTSAPYDPTNGTISGGILIYVDGYGYVGR